TPSAVPPATPHASARNARRLLTGDWDLLQGVAQGCRSEALGDRTSFVELALMIGAPQRGEHARVVGECDGPLVVETQRGERLHGVEDELLGFRELTALHRPYALGLGQQRAPARVPGALGDGLHTVHEGLVVDAPPRRGEDPDGTDQRLVEQTLGVP